MLDKIKKNYFLLITIFLFLYFLFNFLGGERGLFSYFEKKKTIVLRGELLKYEESDLRVLKMTPGGSKIDPREGNI